MALKEFVRKHQNFIGAAVLLFILMLFTAVRYDYYFDLNDDVLMKDILAGVYTGVPEGHNIQMLWLISAFISLFYRIIRGAPWYGLFLCACHYVSLFLIIERSLSFCRKLWEKVLLLVTEGILVLGLFLNHLVSAQYTITCTLLASGAAFLFLTTDITLPVREFLKKNTGTVFLVFVAYLIRSEMLLLVLPLICVAGVIKWGSEERIFTKEHFIKYMAVIGAIVMGILIGKITHDLAYGSRQWQTFTEYFDNRTELYDFQEIPEYETHRAFYEQIGLEESEKELLDNYNFGLDEEIDEKLLGDIAEYAAANRSVEKPFMERLRASVGNYYRRTIYGPSHNESDFPYNGVLIFSYLAVFITAVMIKGKRLTAKIFQISWKLMFLFMVRTTLWIWLIMRDRVPPRISHSMYLMELCILAAMLLMQCKELNSQEKTGLPLAMGILYLFIGIRILPFAVTTTDMDVSAKAENNIAYDMLYEHLGKEENQDHFYFIDVYSSVGYTEKMFADVNNSLTNYDIMGGWACKSPLWRKKLENFGITNMEESLAVDENVYYVQETGKDTKWLYRYYESHGKVITMELVELVGDYFEIYQISE